MRGHPHAPLAERAAALSALTEVMVARLQELNWGEASRRMERLEKIRNRLKSSRTEES